MVPVSGVAARTEEQPDPEPVLQHLAAKLQAAEATASAKGPPPPPSSAHSLQPSLSHGHQHTVLLLPFVSRDNNMR